MKYIIIMLILFLTSCTDIHKCHFYSLSKGMTEEEVIKICGKPDSITSTITDGNKEDTFSYDNGPITYGDYISFRNGVIYDSNYN